MGAQTSAEWDWLEMKTKKAKAKRTALTLDEVKACQEVLHFVAALKKSRKLDPRRIREPMTH